MNLKNNQISAQNAKPVWFWLSFGYLLSSGIVQILGTTVFLYKNHAFTYGINIWQYIIGISPYVLKFAAGLSLVRFRKSCIYYIILSLILTGVFYFISPYTFRVALISLESFIKGFTIGDMIDWAIMIVIIQYLLDLKRENRLR